MTLETAAQLMTSRKVEERIRGVSLLARSSDPARLPLLLKALEDKANYVAAQAAEALTECADDAALGVMRDRFLYLMEDGLKRDPGCHVRANLAFAFGRQEYHWAVEALRVGIRAVQIEAVGGVPFDTAAHLRANCALALAQMRARDALRDISLLLFDTSGNAISGGRHDPAVKMEPRKAAAQAMVMLGDPNALIPLTLRLTYPQGEEAEVLQECMLAVVELEDERALELLRPYLQHSDPYLAAYAALMIARTRAPDAPALLKEVTDRLSGDPLRGVILALTTLRTEEAQAALQEMAEEGREAVRQAVVEVLADAQDEDSRRRLEKIAETDRSPNIRNAARRALSP